MSELFAPLEHALAGLRGRAGIVLADDEGRELFVRDPDGLYLAASVIKLPILMTLYADAAEGLVSLEERIAIGDIVEGSGVLRHLGGVGDLPLRDHAALMTIVSDNTATNAVIDRLGIDRVNDRMAEWGCRGSLLSARLFDREAVARGARNVMTARETASLLQRLVRGALIDRATSDAVLGLLAQATDGGRIRRYLPYDASVAHKPGTLRGVRNDVGVVRVDRPVIAVGFVGDLADEAAGDVVLGLLGWAAYRLAGGGEQDRPPAAALGA
ncbi:MAG TPA: serine hydrolase [Candidatus Limnocylindria bacterium]|nr:serine hydrolase [Candidatus Limnocylindria bacterium]